MIVNVQKVDKGSSNSARKFSGNLKLLIKQISAQMLEGRDWATETESSSTLSSPDEIIQEDESPVCGLKYRFQNMVL